jgi:APA family basic amino acid/polyamine antiporter
VIAAVSYGELSAMFPKAGGQIFILRRHMENLFFYTVEFLCRDTNRYYRRRRSRFAKFTAYLFPIVSDKNILYEIGDFFECGAGCFHFHRFTQLY